MSVTPSSFRALLSELSTALKSFQSSSCKFRIVRTIPPSAPSASPHTLLILDSSFNPPSRAHLHLAASALAKSSLASHPSPHRLLLLFSTHNADKAPSAASFDQRLALMILFAQDLHSHLSSSPDHDAPHIDIGLTAAPYYTDKSTAIATDGARDYPDSPRHIHLMGFDTITRFLAAKYYPSFSPPLSALEPYFGAGHGLRVTLRPSEEFGTVEEQRAWIARLAEGELEDEGGRREWGRSIEVVEAGEGVGVSSTKVRRAAKEGEWEEVQRLCTLRVAGAVREGGFYEADDRGAKMA
ncbi:hypothetical protein CAC42_6502 [Sphaceloma murrayae]|uniref:Nicotinamide-nucleotide adenylyltransferase n=1 Tax=Sphaceloma murrayae TaxID=2082308 RepID=A0A2K1QGG5_9PEZI|nr:hypothetical protein CAC42_6502 [Sphaceloma murrayae]